MSSACLHFELRTHAVPICEFIILKSKRKVYLKKKHFLILPLIFAVDVCQTACTKCKSLKKWNVGFKKKVSFVQNILKVKNPFKNYLFFLSLLGLMKYIEFSKHKSITNVLLKIVLDFISLCIFK